MLITTELDHKHLLNGLAHIKLGSCTIHESTCKCEEDIRNAIEGAVAGTRVRISKLDTTIHGKLIRAKWKDGCVSFEISHVHFECGV
jgi:hypothetical protein